MTAFQILGPLSSLHEMLEQLVAGIPATDVNQKFHPELGTVGWYLGRSVYQELYWLREVIAEDADLSNRVAPFFSGVRIPSAEQCATLPPQDPLLNWAGEIFDEHLMRLANPSVLATHPLLEKDRIQWFLLQELSRNYEAILMVLQQRRLQQSDHTYTVSTPLLPQPPSSRRVEISPGHYRIGARDEPAAYDNELPPQMVELSGFSIAQQPVNNAEFLGFMQAGGYSSLDYWEDNGWDWRQATGTTSPDHWRQDRQGSWYAVGINGPVDLSAQAPVTGLSQHEAKAYACWVSSLGSEWKGAVLQHEYQWEVAARARAITGFGQAREWCANPFHAYPEFQPFPDTSVSLPFFDNRYFSLRGGSLHTQRVLRRASSRDWAAAEQRTHFAGMRLVFPPKAA